MIVAEYIEHLKKLPQGLEVYCLHQDLDGSCTFSEATPPSIEDGPFYQDGWYSDRLSKEPDGEPVPNLNRIVLL